MIQIFCKNTGTSKEFEEGTSLLDMLDSFDFPRPYPIVSAKVNNVSQGLKFRAYRSKEIEFLDARERSGMRVYNRSLAFLLCKAVKDVFAEGRIFIEHPISHSYFCYLKKGDKSAVKAEDIERIAARMREIVGEDLPFKRLEVPVEEAVRIFKSTGSEDKVKLLHTSGEVYTDYYTLGDTPEYFYGRLVPSAGYLKVWDLVPYHNGMLLRVPDKDNPNTLAPFIEQPKTFEVFRENLRWNSIMGLATVG
ncbi:MAG: nucleoside kinase, partial [Bacteroidales bacterium]|nr:nucleoside kinase [Candidatus Egerieousia equi]